MILKFFTISSTKSKKKRYVFDDSIPCLFIKFPGSQIFILYSHGNACDLGDMFNELDNYSQRFQVNVIAYEYQGYGVARGKPTPENVKYDICTIYQFLTIVLNVPSKNIILFGRSIGTGPCLYVAARIEEENPNSLGGVIVQSPFTSIRDLAKSFVGPFLGNLFVGKIFDNFGNIAQVQCPTMVIHGDMDNVIPVEMGKSVFQNSGAPEEYRILKICEGSDHNMWDSENDIYKPISKFIYKHVEGVEAQNEKKNIPEPIYMKNLKRRMVQEDNWISCTLVSTKMHSGQSLERVPEYIYPKIIYHM